MKILGDFSAGTANLLFLSSEFTHPGDNFSTFNPSRTAISEMDSQDPFLADTPVIHKSYVLCLPALKLVATSDMPVCLSPAEAKNPILILPSPVEISAKSNALWLPKGLPAQNLDVQFKVLVVLDVGRLKSSISAMFTGNCGESDYTLFKSSSLIPLSGNGIDFATVFRALFKIIDAYACNKTLLAQVNFDDLIYRQVLTFLLHDPDKRRPSKAERSFRSSLVDDLCAKLSVRLHMSLSLSDIEALSGISIRSLQYAFQERFNCSPMAWLREQRLIKARSELQQDSSPIMDIAVRCGFGSVSLFCRQYRSRYGETPSTTRKNAEQ